MGDAVAVNITSVDIETASVSDLESAARFFIECGGASETTPVVSIVRAWRAMAETLTFRALHAHIDGLMVGRAALFVIDDDGSRHVADVDVTVLPSHQRLGIGRALIKALPTVLPDSVTTLSASTSAASGAAFARSVGFQPVHTRTMHRLMLANVDRDRVERWSSDIDGYSVLSIDGRMPDELVEMFADLWNEMDDAPIGGKERLDRVITADRVRSFEEQVAGSDWRVWHQIARDDTTDELVGFTTVIFDPESPENLQQEDTAVRHACRRRGLGKLIKARVLQKILRELPDAIQITTSNADKNDAMLALNAQLGFEPLAAVTDWQAKTADVLG